MTKPNRQVCPVCKAAISREKVIPLYGRGSSRQDPRDKLPPRPPGQRSEPEHFNSANFPGFGFGDGGFHMSFGIGAFPFGFFASSFNFNDPRTIPSECSCVPVCLPVLLPPFLLSSLSHPVFRSSLLSSACTACRSYRHVYTHADAISFADVPFVIALLLVSCRLPALITCHV